MAGGQSAQRPADRYRRLPTGSHGLEPGEVERDQRKRLRMAMLELIAQRGYPAVRIIDLTKLARISRPTFYSLYADKEALLLAVYDEIFQRTAETLTQAFETEGSVHERLRTSTRAFTTLAAAEPDAISLFVLGALGAGANALQHRSRMVETFEENFHAARNGAPGADGNGGAFAGDLTVKVIFGGIRDVFASRLRQDRASELPGLADELAAWAASYPLALPAGIELPAPPRQGRAGDALPLNSERAQHAQGRLPSGRHDLPRELVVKNQRERIVDATAAIVASKGLAALTIPEIARSANVSHQTFYELYPTKNDAFVGAQKVGMHLALQVAGEAYDAHRDDWPRAIAAALRALIDFLLSEPAHAHLCLVDTFAASPETVEIRDSSLCAFTSYLFPSSKLIAAEPATPAIAAELTAGGIWQVLHYYVESGRIAELPDAAPQLIYMTLTPFLGGQQAAKAALS